LYKIYLSEVTHFKATESASTVKKWEATEATSVIIRCIVTSDNTEPENYGGSENQTPAMPLPLQTQ